MSCKNCAIWKFEAILENCHKHFKDSSGSHSCCHQNPKPMPSVPCQSLHTWSLLPIQCGYLPKEMFLILPLTKWQGEWGGSSETTCGNNLPVNVLAESSLTLLLNSIFFFFLFLAPVSFQYCVMFDSALPKFLYLLQSNAWENSITSAFQIQTKTGRTNRLEM